MFGIGRTPNSRQDEAMDTESLVTDAFAQLGIETRLAEAPIEPSI